MTNSYDYTTSTVDGAAAAARDEDLVPQWDDDAWERREHTRERAWRCDDEGEE